MTAPSDAQKRLGRFEVMPKVSNAIGMCNGQIVGDVGEIP